MLNLAHTLRNRSVVSGICVTRQQQMRWLSRSTGAPTYRSLVSRLGYITNNGVSLETASATADILKCISSEWRDLIAGAEGYLTAKDRRGISGRMVDWGDMDSMIRHVNNVRYIRYAESGRIHWVELLAKMDAENVSRYRELWTPRGTGMILKSILTEFKFPLVFPDRVTVLHKIQPLKESNPENFTLEVVILSEKNRRVAAKCLEDIVIYDYKVGGKAPMPDFLYQILLQVQNEQTEWQKKCLSRLQELDRAVSEIEQQNGY